DAGGERAAILYSLMMTCRYLGINPHAYLTDVLKRIKTQDPEKMEELTPMVWKKQQEGKG
ncbi:MAG TPA: transposase domain-containing protein, partial [Planctomycetes bacterium]|nr:transposase domain-containing protein [Planctomycetota bacterium]